MSQLTPELEALMKKRAQLDARIQNLKAKESSQQRKDDTRRKILVGSYILDKNQKAGTLEKIIQELDKFLSKPNDRALFDLPPRDEKASSQPETV
ncbi:MAG: mobilization protein [Gammaproteobacteria bacterium]|nr:mobilization protein [Gammaproteobacteria bacterium]